MKIMGWAIWGLSCLIMLIQVLPSPNRDPAVRSLKKRFSLLIIIGLVVTAFLGVSKLHLIWWVPFAYALTSFSFMWGVRRAIKASGEELLNQAGAVGGASASRALEVGRDVNWIDMVRQVFRVLEFDRAGTVVGPGNTVRAQSDSAPYGYLLVESPIYAKVARLPIIHQDDFLLAASVFDELSLLEMVKKEELLVAYVPEKYNSAGFSLAPTHVLHYALVPSGTLGRYYSTGADKLRANELLNQIFGGFVYEGEIRVQIKPDLH